MLYSKGYSPQFIVQLIPFAVLLLPNLRGVSYVILLDVINFLEGTVYFIVLPQQHWLLVATVLLRTLIIVALTVEYCFVLFRLAPRHCGALQRRASAAFLVCVALVLGAMIYPLGRAYFSSRQQSEQSGAVVQVAQAGDTPESWGALSTRLANGFRPQLYDGSQTPR